MVGDGRRLVEVVQHDPDRDAVHVGQVAHDVEHLDLVAEVEIGRRLVEQEDGRVLGEAAREPHALCLAARERVDRPLRQVGNPGHGHHALDDRRPLGVARTPAAAVRVAAVLDDLADRHPARGHARLREQRQARGEGRAGSSSTAAPSASVTVPASGNATGSTRAGASISPARSVRISAVTRPPRQLDVDAVDDDGAAISDVDVASVQARFGPGTHQGNLTAPDRLRRAARPGTWPGAQAEASATGAAERVARGPRARGQLRHVAPAAGAARGGAAEGGRCRNRRRPAHRVVLLPGGHGSGRRAVGVMTRVTFAEATVRAHRARGGSGVLLECHVVSVSRRMRRRARRRCAASGVGGEDLCDDSLGGLERAVHPGDPQRGVLAGEVHAALGPAHRGEHPAAGRPAGSSPSRRRPTGPRARPCGRRRRPGRAMPGSSRRNRRSHGRDAAWPWAANSSASVSNM